MLLDVEICNAYPNRPSSGSTNVYLGAFANNGKSNSSGEALSLNVILAKEAAALTASINPASVVGGRNGGILSTSGTSLLSMLARFTSVEF